MAGKNRFTQAIDNLTEGLGSFAELIVVATVIIGFYNVVARYVGQIIGVKLSFNTFLELQWMLFSIVFFLGFAYIMKNGINVRVDFIYTNWSDKRKALVDFVGHILFLVPFCLLGIYVTIGPVLTSWGKAPKNNAWRFWEWTGTLEWSPDPGGLAFAPIKTMIILAFVMLLLQTLSDLTRLWAVIQGKRPLNDAEAPIRIE